MASSRPQARGDQQQPSRRNLSRRRPTTRHSRHHLHLRRRAPRRRRPRKKSKCARSRPSPVTRSTERSSSCLRRGRSGHLEHLRSNKKQRRLLPRHHSLLRTRLISSIWVDPSRPSLLNNNNQLRALPLTSWAVLRPSRHSSLLTCLTWVHQRHRHPPNLNPRSTYSGFSAHLPSPHRRRHHRRRCLQDSTWELRLAPRPPSSRNLPQLQASTSSIQGFRLRVLHPPNLVTRQLLSIRLRPSSRRPQRRRPQWQVSQHSRRSTCRKTRIRTTLGSKEPNSSTS